MIISCVSCVQRSCLDLFIAMKCLVTHVENIPHICQINWEYIVNNIIYYILCILCATIALYLDLCFAMKCLVTHVEKTSALIAPVSASDIGHYCKHHHSNAVISTCLWNFIRLSVFYFSEDLMGQLQARPLGNLLEWPPHGKNLSLTVQLKEMSAHLKIVRCADAVWWPSGPSGGEPMPGFCWRLYLCSCVLYLRFASFCVSSVKTLRYWFEEVHLVVR